MKSFAEEKIKLTEPRKMLISSLTLLNGTLITLLLSFYLQLVCAKIHRFVEYSPRKHFNSFVLSTIDARRQSDENPNYGVFAETNKLLDIGAQLTHSDEAAQQQKDTSGF